MNIINVNDSICTCGTDLDDEEVFQIELDYLPEPAWVCISCLCGLDFW